MGHEIKLILFDYALMFTWSNSPAILSWDRPQERRLCRPLAWDQWDCRFSVSWPMGDLSQRVCWFPSNRIDDTQFKKLVSQWSKSFHKFTKQFVSFSFTDLMKEAAVFHIKKNQLTRDTSEREGHIRPHFTAAFTRSFWIFSSHWKICRYFWKYYGLVIW